MASSESSRRFTKLGNLQERERGRKILKCQTHECMYITLHYSSLFSLLFLPSFRKLHALKLSRLRKHISATKNKLFRYFCLHKDILKAIREVINRDCKAISASRRLSPHRKLYIIYWYCKKNIKFPWNESKQSRVFAFFFCFCDLIKLSWEAGRKSFCGETFMALRNVNRCRQASRAKTEIHTHVR